MPPNVPIKTEAPTLVEKVFILLRANPNATIERLALTLGVSDRTIKRTLKTLQDSGKIKRTGAKKAGQ